MPPVCGVDAWIPRGSGGERAPSRPGRGACRIVMPPADRRSPDKSTEGAGIGGLFSGDGKRPLPIEPAPGETELLREVASKHPGGASVGGDLVLTDRRLVFT